MAYDFGQAFAQMFGGAPIEQRTPQGIQASKMGVQGTQALQQEYARAQNDPNYGLSDPSTSALMEQKIIQDTMSATGAGGAGQSGYERNAVANAVAGFRLQQAAQRQQALNNLRSGMIQSTQGYQQPMGAPTASPLQSFTNTLAGRAANAAGRQMFGNTPEENQQANQAAANQSGGAPGTTGSDPANQRGGMNVNPYRGTWGVSPSSIQ